jgi:hypothetical protein
LKSAALLAALPLTVFLPSCGTDSEDGCEARGTCESAAGGEAGEDSTAGAGGDFGAAGTSGNPGGADAGAGTSEPEQDGGRGGEAGTPSAGAGGESGNAPSCDISRSPREEECLLNEEFAVFVAPSGADDEEGSRGAPVRSIARAFELAADSDRIVIACAALFEEPILLKHGMRLYGGFSCPEDAASDAGGAWRPIDAKTKAIPTVPGFALDIDAANEPVTIQDFELRAQDAVEPSGSSIVARVVNSSDVTLERVVLFAGVGKAGNPNDEAGFTFTPAKSGRDGREASGGAIVTCPCPDGRFTEGGFGGDPGEAGGNGSPDHSSTSGNGGDPARACNQNGNGSRGLNGPAGTDGDTPESLGFIRHGYWVPAGGDPGIHGEPGEGGGGGAGKMELGSSGGGSGGCGGCGGKGGAAGNGGGASIALLSVDSGVILIDSVLLAAAAGHGSSGVTGQPGQTGALGGKGLHLEDFACDGGRGGDGGPGGSGSGAAGGISVGVLHQGDAPVMLGTTVLPGSAGQAGRGGAPGVNDGPAGVSTRILAATPDGVVSIQLNISQE